MRWKADAERSGIVINFNRRGWIRHSGDGDDWHLYWASVQTVKGIFNPESGFRLADNQLINHFPNHYELTRKDLMVKNIKRYRKDVEKESGHKITNFVPTTYVLPADYSLFLEEFRRNVHAMWIMKPTSKAQGKGIFLVNKLSQIKKFANTRWASNSGSVQSYVISRYIESPLLVGGKKFDLRLYVLVTSYRPLKAFMFRRGFARFCNAKYTTDVADLDNQFVHLTNVAIQKHNEDYNEKHGGKWSLDNLKLFLCSQYGMDATTGLFAAMVDIVVHSLRSVQNVMINDKHCFECYGYDLLIDDNLKPWPSG